MNKQEILDRVNATLQHRLVEEHIVAEDADIVKHIDSIAGLLCSWVEKLPSKKNKERKPITAAFFGDRRRNLKKVEGYVGSTDTYHVYSTHENIYFYVESGGFLLKRKDGDVNKVNDPLPLEDEYLCSMLERIKVRNRELEYFDTKEIKYTLGRADKKMDYIALDDDFLPVHLVLENQVRNDGKIYIEYHYMREIAIIGDRRDLFMSNEPDYLIIGDVQVGFIIDKAAKDKLFLL